MSLREAVLEIAGELEQRARSADEGRDITDGAEWRMFANQLRLAVKASQPVPEPKPSEFIKPHKPGIFLHGLDPELVQEAQAESERMRRQADHLERQAPEMVELIDVDSACVEYHPLPPGMPVGAKLPIGRKVFVLAQLDNGTRQLHYSAEETAKRFPQ